MSSPLATALPRLRDAFDAARSKLPCPQPLPEAVEAILFGLDTDGSPCPSPDQVREVTSAHAQELCVLVYDMAWLEECVATGRHPESGRLQLSQARVAWNRQQSRTLLTDRKLRYVGGLAEYERHFGREASNQLDVAVSEIVSKCTSNEPPKVQQDLF